MESLPFAAHAHLAACVVDFVAGGDIDLAVARGTGTKVGRVDAGGRVTRSPSSGRQS
jgi:hypothetical protein